MRILVVAARAPAAHAKGDQVRLAQFLPALCGQHHVTLVCPAPKRIARAAPDQRWVALPVRLTLVERVAGAATAWLRGRPAQTGWCAPRRFRSVVRRAALSCDVALFITVRPYVEVLSVSVVDHVDALSLNAGKRATATRWPVTRWLWRRESARLAAWECRIATRAAAQLVTSAVDAACLPGQPAPVVVPNGVDITPRPDGESELPRDIDVIFTGNMNYPPNRDAVLWLMRYIAPALRARRPAARVMVVGRTARSLPAVPGIEVASDVPSLEPYLRRAKVAVAPLRIGTVIPNKVLEAADAGAAVVLTPQANAGLRFSDQAVTIADSTEEFAAAIDRLLAAENVRGAQVTAARQELTRFDMTTVSRQYELAVTAAAQEQVRSRRPCAS